MSGFLIVVLKSRKQKKNKQFKLSEITKATCVGFYFSFLFQCKSKKEIVNEKAW